VAVTPMTVTLPDRLAPWRVPLVLVAAILASFALFDLFPGLDLWVSGLFYRPDSGFFLSEWPPFHWAYGELPRLTRYLVLALLMFLAVTLVMDRPLGRFDRRFASFLLLMVALGPGLLTNTVLKDHWGRARPSQVTEFGGRMNFTPPLPWPVDQCTSNCSFVSGHGAMAFSLIAFAFLVPPGRRRRLAATAAVAFGAFVGVARIAQGAHFLSDTIFAGLFMALLAWLLHRWIVERDGLAAPWVTRSTARFGVAYRSAIRRLPVWWSRPLPRFGLVTGATVAAILLSILRVDRPLAEYFHAYDDRLVNWLRWITQFGLAEGWLELAAILFIGAQVAARSARFAVWRERLTAWSTLPLFVFCSVAASGLAADLIKILVGRTRPKLWFSEHLFTWGGLAFRADHWSFPSGHVANSVALAAALYAIWPRHVAAYAIFAGLIALSRVGVTAHYVSDTIGAAYIAILVTWYVEGVFRRSGVRLADAAAGVAAPRPRIPWRRRLGFGGPRTTASATP